MKECTELSVRTRSREDLRDRRLVKNASSRNLTGKASHSIVEAGWQKRLNDLNLSFHFSG